MTPTTSLSVGTYGQGNPFTVFSYTFAVGTFGWVGGQVVVEAGSVEGTVRSSQLLAASVRSSPLLAADARSAVEAVGTARSSPSYAQSARSSTLVEEQARA